MDCSVQSLKHLASMQFETMMHTHISNYQHHISNHFFYFVAFSYCNAALDISDTNSFETPMVDMTARGLTPNSTNLSFYSIHW